MGDDVRMVMGIVTGAILCVYWTLGISGLTVVGFLSVSRLHV